MHATAKPQQHTIRGATTRFDPTDYTVGKQDFPQFN